MEHHFNIEIAQKYGVNEAIFLHNIAYWILHNKANGKNLHDGRYWTFNTAKAFAVLFIYWTNQNLRTIIKSCIDQGLIMVGNYNKRKSDRTLWYALTDKALLLYPAIGKIDLSLLNDEGHLLESTNESGRGLRGDTNPPTRAVEHLLESTTPFVSSNTALPNINKDNKQKKKDNRESALSKTLCPKRLEDFNTDAAEHTASVKKLNIKDMAKNFIDYYSARCEYRKDWKLKFIEWLKREKVTTNEQLPKNNEVRSTVPWFSDNH